MTLLSFTMTSYVQKTAHTQDTPEAHEHFRRKEGSRARLSMVSVKGSQISYSSQPLGQQVTLVTLCTGDIPVHFSCAKQQNPQTIAFIKENY